MDTYKAFVAGDNAEIEKYSHVASLDEIKENEYNLNIPLVDIEELNKEIAVTEKELVEVKAKMQGYLKELGLC